MLVVSPPPLEVHSKDESKTMNGFSFVKKVSFENIEKWLGRKVLDKVDVGALLLGLAVLTYTVLLSYFTILRHYEFETYAWIRNLQPVILDNFAQRRILLLNG